MLVRTTRTSLRSIRTAPTCPDEAEVAARRSRPPGASLFCHGSSLPRDRACALPGEVHPELPQKLQTQNTAYQDNPTGIDWDHVIDQINKADTAQDHGSKVPLMVGDTGFEPVTSAV